MSIAQFQDRQRIGWSRTRKWMFYAGLILIGVEIQGNYWNTDILYTFNQTPQNLEIIQKCPTLRQGVYKPTIYLQTAFLQSLYGSKFDPVPYVPMTRVEVPVENGLITIDSLPVNQKFLRSDKSENPKQKTLIILHGLTGASECNYIRHTVLHANRKGFRVYCINMRGYANSRMISAQTTDYSKLDDLLAGVNYIKSQNPDAPLYMLGFSIGSLQLVKFLAKYKDIVKGAVAISCPWDIQTLAQEVKKPTKFIYNMAITRNFIRNMKWNLDVYKMSGIDVDQAQKCYRTEDFDELVTKRVLGYENIQDLYKKINCVKEIQQIEVPTLFISSMDDPVIQQTLIPKDEILNNKNIILALTKKGGHIEWFTGFKAVRWINKPVIEFLNCLDSVNNKNISHY
ncbi:unnamed protein product [Paramecium primaurelia]|uniref:Serine aminopeptidase S33 domain-containing protein n=1 Tax=Paramecium primaurelia TaxID=5886 RepID=A0A8S1K5E7_PARPR|nr:unnamed protein product [Paramecium primaurelia]